jgi:hypothetical protein
VDACHTLNKIETGCGDGPCGTDEIKSSFLYWNPAIFDKVKLFHMNQAVTFGMEC